MAFYLMYQRYGYPGPPLQKLLVVVAGCLLFACQSRQQHESAGEPEASPAGQQELLARGKALSKAWCQQCHAASEPALLPRHIWQNEVLPRMGAFLGIYEKQSRAELIEGGAARSAVVSAKVFPASPRLPAEDWEAIKAWYLSQAPDSLPRTAKRRLPLQAVFAAKAPETRVNPPMTTLLDYQPASGLVYHSDVKRGVSPLNIFNARGELLQAIALKSPAVRVREDGESLLALTMGSFSSSDAPTGKLVRIGRKNAADSLYNSMEVLIDGLRRPVDMAWADLDGDGDEDVAIAQFGNWTGKLEWFENEEGKYRRHLLHSGTGATQVQAEDLNSDGLPDLLALVAQGEETIYALLNQGNGKFSKQKLLQFPPSYGSVSFNYVDVNGDGYKDLVHASGDNADYEAIPKPYHGIRVYTGAPGLQFTESCFFPLHGAYQAEIADFDGDSDLDIAAISFFPDYATAPEESFVMLQNESTADSLAFVAFSIPEATTGRWIVMDSGDLDNDGATDLLLGAFVVQNPYGAGKDVKKTWLKDSPSLLMLFNRWNMKADRGK